MNIFFLSVVATIGVLTRAELDLTLLCSDKSLNDVWAHPQDCRGYVVCSEEPSLHYCEIGFHFDTKRMVCNRPEIANCQLTSTPMDAIEDFDQPVFTPFVALDIRTGESIDPMVGFEPLSVACRYFGAYFLPNPKQCRSYYLCAYGHMHEHACGPDTLWNYKTQQCVPSHKAVCYNLNEEEEKEINAALANLMSNSSVTCYPVNANITTTETISATNSNQTGLTMTMTTAMATAIATTTPTPIPVSPIMTETTFTTVSSKRPNLSSNTYNIACPPRRQSYVAHPKDCGKYFMCIKGIAVLTSCPEGLLWDSKQEYCDFGKKVKCFRERNI